jgi:hypothetical protein
MNSRTIAPFHIITLSHYHIITLSYYHILTMSYSHDVIFSRCHILTLHCFILWSPIQTTFGQVIDNDKCYLNTGVLCFPEHCFALWRYSPSGLPIRIGQVKTVASWTLFHYRFLDTVSLPLLEHCFATAP